MEAASFVAGVRQQRYSVQQEIGFRIIEKFYLLFDIFNRLVKLK
jgi:hypothetical protein